MDEFPNLHVYVWPIRELHPPCTSPLEREFVAPHAGQSLSRRRGTATVRHVSRAQPESSITILSRLGEFSGRATERAAYFDRLDEKAGRMVRHFVLLEESVKLMYEPWGWINEWYVDIVRLEHVRPEVLRLHDLYVDIVIEGSGPTYRLIDLDDVATALENGEINDNDAAEALATAQRFLDRHIHRRRDFPPMCIKQWMTDEQTGVAN